MLFCINVQTLTTVLPARRICDIFIHIKRWFVCTTQTKWNHASTKDCFSLLQYDIHGYKNSFWLDQNQVPKWLFPPYNSFVVNGNLLEVIANAAVTARRNKVYCRHHLVKCSLLLSWVTVCIGCYLMQVLHLRTHWPRFVYANYGLTHWGRDKMAAILPDDIFKYILLNWNRYMVVEMSPRFVPKGSVNNIPALVQIMVWRRSGGIAYFRRWCVAVWVVFICISFTNTWDPQTKPLQETQHNRFNQHTKRQLPTRIYRHNVLCNFWFSIRANNSKSVVLSPKSAFTWLNGVFQEIPLCKYYQAEW